MKKNYLSVRIDDEMREQIKEVMELIYRKFPVPMSRGYKLRLVISLGLDSIMNKKNGFSLV